MECYNCGAELTKEDFCPDCGIDVSVYKKIIRTANLCYNEGLARASIRDLTGAAECLKACLRYNKNHKEARNLLGLIYFEMGETVEALSQWVISKNLHPRDDIAARYLDEVQKNPAKLEARQSDDQKIQSGTHLLQTEQLRSGGDPVKEGAVLKPEAGQRTSAFGAFVYSGQKI